MVCQKCNSTNIRVMLDVMISTDHHKARENGITKKLITSAVTEILAVHWQDADYLCGDCGHVIKSGKKANE